MSAEDRQQYDDIQFKRHLLPRPFAKTNEPEVDVLYETLLPFFEESARSFEKKLPIHFRSVRTGEQCFDNCPPQRRDAESAKMPPLFVDS